MLAHLASPVTLEIAAFVSSVAMVVAYQMFLAHKTRIDPDYMFRATMARARSAWVLSVMNEGRDILAVQTLRNSTMAASFLASTSALMMIGVMTLSAQGEKLGETWQALNVTSAVDQQLWLLKLLALLATLLFSFFSFTMAVRQFHHLGYMLNVPISGKYGRLAPEIVVAQMERASHFYWFGMRSYFFLAPLVLWLFGPHFIVGGTIILIAVLYRLDHVPNPLVRRAPEAALVENR